MVFVGKRKQTEKGIKSWQQEVCIGCNVDVGKKMTMVCALVFGTAICALNTRFGRRIRRSTPDLLAGVVAKGGDLWYNVHGFEVGGEECPQWRDGFVQGEVGCRSRRRMGALDVSAR
jgi:hypothetical protein